MLDEIGFITLNELMCAVFGPIMKSISSIVTCTASDMGLNMFIYTIVPVIKSYLKSQLRNHPCLESDWQAHLIEHLVNFVWLHKKISQLCLPQEEARVDVGLIEHKEVVFESTLELIHDEPFE